ncbi:RNA methyltransferase [Balneolales bacterium ANBcel1]|nr:RNA methyltransferase [Balneolales bacterium ANBcel1]
MDRYHRLSKKEINELRQLRKRPERHRRRRFVAEGERTVRQILLNGILSVEQLIVELQLNSEDGEKMAGSARKGHPLADIPEILHKAIPKRSVSAQEMRRLSDTETAQGVMAVCRIPPPKKNSEMLDGEGIVLVADRVQDPGNLGTMIRTAVWFGLKGVVTAPGTVDLFHPKVVRSTAGATGILDWVEADLPPFLLDAAQMGWQVLVLDAGDRSVSYQSVKKGKRQMIVVGNEANGIDEAILRQDFGRIRIDRVPGSMSASEQRVDEPKVSRDPDGDSNQNGDTEGADARRRNEGKPQEMFRNEDGIESLNASVAAAIVMARLAAD